MLVLEIDGSPYEIGYKHGSLASAEVRSSCEIYEKMFRESSNLSWEEALKTANEFEPHIRENFPRYHEELRGLADGASRPLEDILLLNLRTEIVYGKLNDGCTSAYVKSAKSALLSQNWDWVPAQASNLILMTIRQQRLPTIKFVTEAGIIGKIGLNSAGVGVCFNALRIKGVSPTRIPAHLALRTALEATSVKEAERAIENAGGLASACYLLIGDKTEAVGLENTAWSCAKQRVDEWGRVVHANNLLLKNEHGNADELDTWVKDSSARVSRLEELLAHWNTSQTGQPSQEEFGELFEDQKGYPMSICRAAAGKSTTQSLFNIVMDLSARTATVTEGRPGEGGKEYALDFQDDIN